MRLVRRIAVAAGRRPADLLLTNARVVSVLADRIVRTNVAIADGVIVGFGDYRARKQIDCEGGYLSAGFIDSHLHIESTLLTPAQFARAVVPRGTTAVVADPHEIANVLGARGVRWMAKASAGLPLDVHIDLPSCVPASRFEGAGARLTARDLKALAKLPQVVGMGEVMDFPGVIAGKRELLEKIRLLPGRRCDGHAPGLSGKALAAYVAAGIHSDHESTTAAEAREKLFAGLHIMIREGTTEKNLAALAPIVTPANSHRCFFCSDDRSAHDLVRHGHMDDILRRAVRAKIPAVTALQMSTNNAPYYFRLERRQGAVAVGYVADLVLLDSLRSFRARMVFKGGRLVARAGKLVVPCRSRKAPPLANTMRVKGLAPDRFRIRARGHRTARIIRIVPGQIVTREERIAVTARDGCVASDVKRDLLLLAAVERHDRTGKIGLGLVRGFGIKRGALASTVCHDAHNLICVGTSAEECCAACRALVECGGGFAAVRDGVVRALLPLPVAGLMSDRPVERVADDYAALEKAARALGAQLPDPFLQLSFLGLSVIPELKLTVGGLVDTRSGRRVPLFV